MNDVVILSMETRNLLSFYCSLRKRNVLRETSKHDFDLAFVLAHNHYFVKNISKNDKLPC